MSSAYYTLMGSLPALPSNFVDAERVPISRSSLDERLKMLTDHDGVVIQAMTDFLVWERQPIEHSDEEVVRHYEQFMQTIRDAFAKSLIREVMVVRTIFAGLRCRRLSLDPPTGVSAVAKQMAQHWSHPDFRLGTHFPWITEVDELLRGDAPFDLEQTRYEVFWRRIKSLSDQYYFSFEAVVLYLMRWEILYRWTRRDAAVGREKFEQLVTAALGSYATMFAE